MQVDLTTRGKAGAGVSVVNRVMSQIRASQQPATGEADRDALGRAGFWRWAMGFGAVAGAAVLGTLLLTSPATKATAAEVMSRGVEAVRQLARVHLVCRVRTAPNDNFAQIDPKTEFVTVELWKEFGDPPKWRVEKPGRVAVVDGRSTLLYLKDVFPQSSMMLRHGHPAFLGAAQLPMRDHGLQQPFKRPHGSRGRHNQPGKIIERQHAVSDFQRFAFLVHDGFAFDIAPRCFRGPQGQECILAVG